VLEGHPCASAEPDASRHHLLVVGPRGIGKSHLIAVIVNRLKADASLREKLAIAWLPEDPWAISNFADLLREILRALGGDVTWLHSIAPKEIESRAWNYIVQELAGRRLLVVVENLDEILHNFKVKDQQKWRGGIQNTGIWAVLVGACSLTLNFTDHDAPFYGFFAVTPLTALSSSGAVEFMVKMAEAQGNTVMLAQLQTAEGRAKVRCVYHLAGGNPRVFVTFFQMLAEGLDDDLTTPALKLVDAMTPSYQSQMKTVSAQQRKILEVLCRASAPMSVKTISQECGVSQQVASAQLGQLAERRFVNVARDGRELNYDLAEPLMRICVDAKQRGPGPLRFGVEFLRYWFTYEDLLEMNGAVPCEPHLSAAVNAYSEWKSAAKPLVAAARSASDLLEFGNIGRRVLGPLLHRPWRSVPELEIRQIAIARPELAALAFLSDLPGFDPED